DVAAAELAEDPALPGLDRPGMVADDAVEHVQAHVLDVDVVDATAPVAQRLDRVGAADQEVAGVDEQADVGELEHAVDLPGRFDERARVGVEGRLEAAAARELLGAAEAVGEAAPSRLVESERTILGTAAGIGAPLVGAAVAEDRSRGSTRGREEVERPVELGEVILPVLRL